ncbi:hypothetical protein [Methyloglobulus morosus]|nr:hypothetical protein [Methyloglobulus morosus]
MKRVHGQGDIDNNTTRQPVMAKLTKDQIHTAIVLKNGAEDCQKKLDALFKETNKIDPKKASQLKRIIGKLKTWCVT